MCSRVCTGYTTFNLRNLNLWVKVENGTGSLSAGCIARRDQSIVRPSRRAGVPVFTGLSADSFHGRFASASDGCSPTRPAGVLS